jgi:hypothetical protein
MVIERPYKTINEAIMRADKKKTAAKTPEDIPPGGDE